MGNCTWPTGIRQVLISGKNIKQFTAGATISAGQVVAINATGPATARTVQACVNATTATIVGVALYDATSGAEVAVACRGCIAYVVNGIDNENVEAGDVLIAATTAGTVRAKATGAGAVTPANNMYVGFAIENITAAGAGQQLACDIAPGYLSTA